MRPAGFAIGIENVHTEGYGMTHGPTPTIAPMLEVIGEVGSCIIHFRNDNTQKVVWRWDVDRWIKTKQNHEQDNGEIES